MTAQRKAKPKPTLAVVGATGAVGTVMLDLLSTRDDVWGEVRLVASPRSAGRQLRVRGQDTEVQALAEDVFDGVDVAMFDVPDEVSARWAPVAAERGAVVVSQSDVDKAVVATHTAFDLDAEEVEAVVYGGTGR